MTAGVHAGLGRHTYYLDSHQRSQAMKLNLIANPFGVLAYSLPNLSVAMFLNRILALDRGRKWFIYSVAISQNVFALASSILLFVQCVPLSFLWNHSIKATCLPIDGILAYSYFVGGQWCILLRRCISSSLDANIYRSLFGIYRCFSRGRSNCCVLEAAIEVED